MSGVQVFGLAQFIFQDTIQEPEQEADELKLILLNEVPCETEDESESGRQISWCVVFFK